MARGGRESFNRQTSDTSMGTSSSTTWPTSPSKLTMALTSSLETVGKEVTGASRSGKAAFAMVACSTGSLGKVQTEKVRHPHMMGRSERTGHWRCNGCRRMTMGNADMKQSRFRCEEGCDFDLCSTCYELWLDWREGQTQVTAQEKRVEPVPARSARPQAVSFEDGPMRVLGNNQTGTSSAGVASALVATTGVSDGDPEALRLRPLPSRMSMGTDASAASTSTIVLARTADAISSVARGLLSCLPFPCVCLRPSQQKKPCSTE